MDERVAGQAEPEAAGTNDATEAAREPAALPLGEGAAEVADVSAALAEAVGRYREALRALHPELPAEVLTGATVAELDAALERALAVREQVARALARSAVPAGAPVRGEPGVEGLSPFEKIRAGLARQR